MKQVRQSLSSPFPDEFRGIARLLHNHLQVVVRLWQSLPDTVQLTEDSHLHLLGGLVREGHCQDVPITRGILHDQSDVFGSKGKGLSTTGTRLIDSQGFYHRLKSSKSKVTPAFWNLVL